MVLIDLDRRSSPAAGRAAVHPARKIAALGVLAALVVLPGETPKAADHAPRPAPACSVIYGDGSELGGRGVDIDPVTGQVIAEVPADEITVIMSICPD